MPPGLQQTANANEGANANQPSDLVNEAMKMFDIEEEEKQPKQNLGDTGANTFVAHGNNLVKSSEPFKSFTHNNRVYYLVPSNNISLS